MNRAHNDPTTMARWAAAFFFSAVIFFGAARTTNAAFGISPPFINTNYLVPGVTYQQTIYLVQDKPDVALDIHADLNVPDTIKSWVSVDKGFDFTIPQGIRQYPVVVSIKVPKDAALNKYSGTLVFSTVPGKTGQVTISIGGTVAINIAVGNNILEKFSTQRILFPDIEEGWNPRVTVRFENDGNIPEKFDSATFDLYDQYNAARLAYVTKTDGMPSTPPFTTNEYTIEFPTDFHLGVGDYWGNVSFYKDNKVVSSAKAIFHVLPAGSLSSFGKITASLKQYWFYYLIGFLALLLLGKRFWAKGAFRKMKHAE